MTKIDPRWEDTKRAVDQKWGRKCIFSRCLSITESKMLVDGTPKCVDRCHVISRSSEPSMVYNPNNIVPLQRFIHHRMDNFLSPLTGEDIDSNMHFFWWMRIHQKKVMKYNPDIDYEYELKKMLKVI